jgi:DNA-binding MarR family transcriptional regulator
MRERSEMFRALATDEDLDGVDLRVFFYLASELDFENFTRIEQRDIAEALGRHRQHVSRSMNKLKAKKIVLEASPRVGRSCSYVLNPKFGK